MANTFNLTGTFKDAENNPLHVGGYIIFRVTSVGADPDTNFTYPRKPVEFLVDANGEISGTLWTNGNSDTTTTYEILFPDGQVVEVILPDTIVDDATVDIDEILINYQVTTSGTQAVTLDAAKVYTDALANDPSSNPSFAPVEWRSDLGLDIGVDVQAYDDQLSDIAGLSPTDGGIIVGDGLNFILETGSTARTSLGLGSSDSVTHGSLALTTALPITSGGTGGSSASSARTSLGVEIGTDVQAQSDVLSDIDSMGAPTADGEFIVATGAGTFAYESGSTARESLGFPTNAVKLTTSVVVTTYTALVTDSVLLCDNSAGVTITLMAAATAGDGFEISIKNAGAEGTVTIDASGSETIDGDLETIILAQYDSLALVCDGSNWHII